MKKKAAKRIKDIAEKMGAIIKQDWEWVPITGADLLLCGRELTRGKAIDPEKTYEIKVPIYYEYSAEKELKRQASKNGEKGIYQTVLNEYNRRMS